MSVICSTRSKHVCMRLYLSMYLHNRSDDCFLVASIALQLVWQVCANDECNSSGVRPLDELEARCAPTTSATILM